MNFAVTPPTRDRMAIGLSLAVHALAFAALVRVSLPANAPPDEASPVVNIVHFETRAHVAPSRPTVATAAHTMRHNRPPNVHLVAVARPPEMKAMRAVVRTTSAFERVAAQPRVERVSRVDPPETRSVAVPEAPASAVALATAAPAAAPAAAATASPTTAPPIVLAASSGGLGPFGAMHPPVLLPTGADRAFRLLGIRFHVRVAVDERGHATELRWILPIGDPTVRERVAAALMSASYVPGECDGLACSETYELKN